MSGYRAAIISPLDSVNIDNGVIDLGSTVVEINIELKSQSLVLTKKYSMPWLKVNTLGILEEVGEIQHDYVESISLESNEGGVQFSNTSLSNSFSETKIELQPIYNHVVIALKNPTLVINKNGMVCGIEDPAINVFPTDGTVISVDTGDRVIGTDLHLNLIESSEINPTLTVHDFKLNVNSYGFITSIEELNTGKIQSDKGTLNIIPTEVGTNIDLHKPPISLGNTTINTVGSTISINQFGLIVKQYIPPVELVWQPRLKGRVLGTNLYSDSFPNWYDSSNGVRDAYASYPVSSEGMSNTESAVVMLTPVLSNLNECMYQIGKMWGTNYTYYGYCPVLSEDGVKPVPGTSRKGFHISKFHRPSADEGGVENSCDIDWTYFSRGNAYPPNIKQLHISDVGVVTAPYADEDTDKANREVKVPSVGLTSDDFIGIVPYLEDKYNFGQLRYNTTPGIVSIKNDFGSGKFSCNKLFQPRGYSSPTNTSIKLYTGKYCYFVISNGIPESQNDTLKYSIVSAGVADNAFFDYQNNDGPHVVKVTDDLIKATDYVFITLQATQPYSLLSPTDHFGEGANRAQTPAIVKIEDKSFTFYALWEYIYFTTKYPTAHTGYKYNYIVIRKNF